MRFIHRDELAPVARAFGVGGAVRASHVEPWDADPMQWGADLSPVGGPMLGPFTTRRAALDAEVAWLNANNLGG